MVNHPRCRLLDRANAIVASCEAAARRRSRSVLYILNVVSRSSRVYQWIEELSKIDRDRVQLGLMVNGFVMGFETVAEIREAMPEWPLIATTVASGMMILAPQYNVSEHILVQLARLAGADAVYSVRHATEYIYDPSKIDTLQRHLKQNGQLVRPSMPIYAGSISLGTIVREELPATPGFMLQAGSTICGYTQSGLSFPETVTTATSTIIDALRDVYIGGASGKFVAEKLARDNARRGRGLDLAMLGLTYD